MPRKLTSVPAAKPAAPPPDLRESVRTALAAMTWLGPSDEALKTLAMQYASQIESAVDRAAELADLRREFGGDLAALRRLQKLEAMCEVTKLVGWQGPLLQGVLRDLGGTPAARKALTSVDKPIGGRLAQLRAAASGVDDS